VAVVASFWVVVQAEALKQCKSFLVVVTLSLL
jgi:hypothetical protein